MLTESTGQASGQAALPVTREGRPAACYPVYLMLEQL
jgi:hypothetical protein